jgi:Scaffold protein Nfu/NifU N terminal
VGQPISVVERPTARADVVRFEINRSLTGMGHERYRSRDDATGPRPPDELARRLFDHGGVEAVHVYSNVITVDLASGATGAGLADVIENLFIHYVPGVLPPTDEELVAPE